MDARNFTASVTCKTDTAFLWLSPFWAAKVRKPAGQGQRFYGNVLFVQPRSGNQLAKDSVSMAMSFLCSQGQETSWPRTAFLWQCPFCAAKVRKPAGQGQRFYGNVLFVQPRSGNQLAKNIILMAIPFLCSQSHEAGRSRTTFLWQRHFCTTKVMMIGTATPPRKNPSTITWHTLPPITHPLLQNWRGNGCVWQLSRLEGHKMNTSD